MYTRVKLASGDAVMSEIRAMGLSTALVIDSASVPELRLLLNQTHLTFHSLFSGPDDAVLEDEAPVFVSVEPKDAAIVSRLDETEGADFICLGHAAESKRIVRHLRAWLSVRLPHDAPERSEEDKPVLFRFYDPRILAVFLGTLAADEAAAFNGPVQAWGTGAPVAQLWTPTAATLTTPPSLRRPDLYRIRPDQYALFAQHSKSAFENALMAYLNEEFAEETSSMAPGEVEDLVARANHDAKRLEDTRPGSIATIAVLHLLRPDLMRDEFVWSEVMGGNPEGKNPNQRIGLLSAYHTIDLPSVAAYDAFFARLDRFWECY